MAKISCLLLLAVVHLASSLKCYKCNGCETATTQTETCRDVDAERQDVACLTQKVRVGGSSEPLTIKKCAIYEKNRQYNCTMLPDSGLISCNICHGDYCNGATTTAINASMMGLMILIFLVPKFFYY